MLFFRNVVDYITKYSEIDYTLENDKLVLKDYYKNSASERKAFELYVKQRGVKIYRIMSFKKVPQERFYETMDKIKANYKKLGKQLEEIDSERLTKHKEKSYKVPTRLHTIDYYKNGSLLISGQMEDVASILRFRPSLKDFIKSDTLIIEVEERNGKPIGEGIKALWSNGFTNIQKEIELNDLQ